MGHVLAVVGLVAGVLVWYRLQLATGRIDLDCEDEPVPEACGACSAPCEKSGQP